MKYYSISRTGGVKYKITQMIFGINKKGSLLLIFYSSKNDFSTNITGFQVLGIKGEKMGRHGHYIDFFIPLVYDAQYLL